MRYATAADVLRPADGRLHAAYEITLVACLSIVVGLSSKVGVRLPFTPVPVTMQTFAVLFLAMLLGGARGAAVAAAYVAEGAAGFPVFAFGGGISYLAGPTGGYLIGFVAGAYLTGLLAQRGFDRGFFPAFAAMVSGLAVVYGCGAAWLAVFVGPWKSLALGVAPFVAWDALKIAAASILLPYGRKFLLPVRP